MDTDDDYADPDTPRTAGEIARRAIVLHCVIAAAYDVSRENLIAWLKEEDLWEAASPAEQRFLTTATPPKQDTINAKWRAEAQVALLWAIGKIPSLGSLSESCDTGPLVDAIPAFFTPTKEFIETAVLRDEATIHEEYENVYDAHWKTRDAIRRKVPIPDDVKPSIVQERHHGFNWLTGYCGQEWDEISTDT